MPTRSQLLASVRSEREVERPQLVFAYAQTSGASRRADGFLAQVLQRRRNHDSFRLYRLEVRQRPELAQRLGIEEVPTLLVIEEGKIAARLVRPRGCSEVRSFLAPWLR